MSQLYWITGNTAELQEKVYNAILRWSQSQQVIPLQPWPYLPGQTPEEAVVEPNLYLYQYLGWGNGQILEQLIAQYGEDAVEIIYLRTEEDTEEGLLEAGIYKSYDPQKDIPACVKDIVETVFSGYQGTDYDFTEKPVDNTQEAASSQAESEGPKLTPEQIAKRKRRNRRLALCFGILVWLLIVCMITSVIYTAVNHKKPRPGNLIQVTAPPIEEEDLAVRFPEFDWELDPDFDMDSDMTTEVESLLRTPAVNASLDIFDRMNSNIGVVYENGEMVYIPDASGSYLSYQKSYDAQTAALLTKSGNLWLVDNMGAHQIATTVYQFALSLDGSYLYYICDDGVRFINIEENVFCLIPQDGNWGQFETWGDGQMIASPKGTYCVIQFPDGTVKYVNIYGDGGLVNISMDKLLYLTENNILYGVEQDTKEYLWVDCTGWVEEPKRIGTKTAEAGDTAFYFSMGEDTLLFVEEGVLYYASRGESVLLGEIGAPEIQLLTEKTKRLETGVYQILKDRLQDFVFCVGDKQYHFNQYLDHDHPGIELIRDYVVAVQDSHLFYEEEGNLYLDYDGLTTQPILQKFSDTVERVICCPFSLTGSAFFLDTSGNLFFYSETKDLLYDLNAREPVLSYCYSSNGTEFYFSTEEARVMGVFYNEDDTVTMKEFTIDLAITSFDHGYVFLGDAGVYYARTALALSVTGMPTYLLSREDSVYLGVLPIEPDKIIE